LSQRPQEGRGRHAPSTVQNYVPSMPVCWTTTPQWWPRTDSVSSIYQLRKMMLMPSRMESHLHPDLLQEIARLIRNRPSPVTILKVTSHNGSIGNEMADDAAKLAADPATRPTHNLSKLGERSSHEQMRWPHAQQFTGPCERGMIVTVTTVGILLYVPCGIMLFWCY
jgi:hypothetical protein